MQGRKRAKGLVLRPQPITQPSVIINKVTQLYRIPRLPCHRLLWHLKAGKAHVQLFPIGCIPFWSAGFRLLYMMAHCVVLLGHLNGTQLLLMLSVTLGVFLLWQVTVSAVKKAFSTWTEVWSARLADNTCVKHEITLSFSSRCNKSLTVFLTCGTNSETHWLYQSTLTANFTF